jgi:ribosomal protein S14
MGRLTEIAHRVKRSLGYVPATLHCTACGRPSTDPVAFISGPGLYLCGPCVRDAENQAAHVDPAIRPKTRCQFCGEYRPLVSFGAASLVNVCIVCVKLMTEMVDEYDDASGPSDPGPS